MNSRSKKESYYPVQIKLTSSRDMKYDHLEKGKVG